MSSISKQKGYTVKKFAITVAEIDGEIKVLDGPSEDVDKLREAARKLTADSGSGSDSLVIMHSKKGVILKRKGFNFSDKKPVDKKPVDKKPKK